MKIVNEILKNREFNKLKDFTHHKTTRLEHSKRVAYLSYRICKKFNLDYISAARGAMLHDFFLNKYTAKNTNKLIRNHPKIASTNAKKHFKLSRKEINIIESHMFPMTVKVKPKYKESYIVAISDKIVWALNINTAAWSAGADGYYYYNSALAPGETTAPIFTEVTFRPEMGNEYQNATATVDVTAQAVQTANNGATAAEAAGWPSGEPAKP